MKEKHKILIVAPKYESPKKNYDYFFPSGLAYISAVLKKTGGAVDCLNLNHFNKTTKEILNQKLNQKNYDFVLTGNNAIGYTATKIILDTAKSHSSRPKTVLGGPLITSEPELIFKDLNPDFGVIGEGEETIVELLKCLEKQRDLKTVDGLIYYGDGKINRTNRRKPIKNIDSLPFPDMEGFGFKEYLDNAASNWGVVRSLFDYPRFYPLIGSRSCPFQCTFCYHYDSIYRSRPIDNIMKEIELAVKKYKINGLWIYDECFSINRKRLIEFCKGIKKLREKLPYDLKWFPQLRVDFMDKELLKIMKDAGCALISYGFESFSPIVLKSMKKGITLKQIDNAFKETVKEKIGVQACFIFGDVAETKETAYETLNYWKKNLKGQVQLVFISPYPNSEIYQHCIKKGIIKNKLKFIKHLKKFGDLEFNMTNSMTNQELKNLDKDLALALAKYRKFIKPISSKRTGKNIYKFKVKCPYCNEIIEYKNCLIKNSFSYSFNVICRNCSMRFFITNSLRKFVYEHYDKLKKLRDLELDIIKFIKKKKQ